MRTERQRGLRRIGRCRICGRRGRNLVGCLGCGIRFRRSGGLILV